MIKKIYSTSIAGIISFFFAIPSLAVGENQRLDLPNNQVKKIQAYRCRENPLITADSSQTIGKNINGPSVIRVPSWIEKPLGKYYMYFADHKGKYIRLAYANSLCGSWTVYEPGTLKIEQALAFRHHIASPDVHIDRVRQQIRMYFHGPTKERKKQWTGVATSTDGINFKASNQILGKFYFRVWQWRGDWYALAKNWNKGWGELYRSSSAWSGFQSRGNFLNSVRHTAVLIHKHYLLVFYSRVGDAPERIMVATVDMRPNWLMWQPSNPLEVLRPEANYEGIEYPIEPSQGGPEIEVNQLRDQFVYQENGKVYLFYSIAGEMGIAMAELKIEMK